MTLSEEIKQRVDIVEVISQYVSLAKSGRNFRALCPFHQEKSPSFYIYPHTQTWHCFGQCSTGGDIFSFLMKREKLSFSEALKSLARRTGVSLPEKKTREKEGQGRLFQAVQEAASFYNQHLLSAPGAREARAYLEKRGISPETVKAYLLGFSPDSWDSLRQHLLLVGYGEEEGIAAGLLKEREGGGSYDFFRRRLMFPIWDDRGRPVGFGGRALDDSLPKYLNSPQSAIFDKGSLLYGLHRAREAIREQQLAVVVEGYFDVLIAHQKGIANVVASLGIALTSRQASLLKGLAPRLALALDPDAAGEEATLRALEEVLGAFQTGLMFLPHRGGTMPRPAAITAEVSVITLPQGKDPDEVILEDPHGWQALLEVARPAPDFIIEAVLSRANLVSPQGKSLALSRLHRLLVEMADPIQQDHYMQKAARLAGVTLASLKRHLAAYRPPKGKTEAPKATPLPEERLEEYCLYLLLSFPELKAGTPDLLTEYFLIPENREIYSLWAQKREPDFLRRSLDPVLLPHLESLQSLPSLPPRQREEGERALVQVMNRLKERYIKRQNELILADEELCRSQRGREALKANNAQLRELYALRLQNPPRRRGEKDAEKEG